MEDDPDQSAIGGDASGATYDVLTGGTYADNQDPFTAADTGTVNNAIVGTGNAAPTATPPAGGSATTPPSWLSGLLGLAPAVGQAYTQVAPLINGTPAVSPTQAGQKPATGTSTITIGGTAYSTTTVFLAVAGIAAAIYFFFIRKK